MGWTRVGVVAIAVALLGSACGASEEENRFGPIVASVSELIGTEVEANAVVSMPCIPSRRDPVGVWLAFRVVDFNVGPSETTIELEPTDARLGSHPSGCRNPEILVAQSAFMLIDDQPIFATSETRDGSVSTLSFMVEQSAVTSADLVIVPTFEFETGSGERQTTIFGLVGRYSID